MNFREFVCKIIKAGKTKAISGRFKHRLSRVKLIINDCRGTFHDVFCKNLLCTKFDITIRELEFTNFSNIVRVAFAILAKLFFDKPGE